MNLQQNIPLAPYTSFGVGGKAEHFAVVSNTKDLLEALKCTLPETQLWLLGYGSNSLISDHGLSGMVLCIRGGSIVRTGNTIIADAGAWWDDVVLESVNNNLWGIELLSEVPGSVGAALFINIAAYGQSIGTSVLWVEVWDRNKSQVIRLGEKDLHWGYKESIFQKSENKHLIIVRAAFTLSKQQNTELSYQKALDVATELHLNPQKLSDRRIIITEARNRAGSLWRPQDTTINNTVGSFFRNPIVSEEQADLIIQNDETGKSKEAIKKMNKVHGGVETRVSAAHVMLAAGFSRGQTWGKVKLNDQNLLKIEALPGATAQEIFDVAMHIQSVCEQKLTIRLEPEARILGSFDAKT